MKQKHYVILIPGLGDDIGGLELATNHWRKHGLTPSVYSFSWHDGKKFHPKLNSLLIFIDKLSKTGTVSLVGTSAGGSAALNAFMKRKDIVHRVINLCGRVRTGPLTGFRSYASQTATSPAFAESIKFFENQEYLLSKTDREKIMTVSPLFGDELVPPDTVSIDGAYNITIPTTEHLFSIMMSLTLFSKKLIHFLNSPL